MRLPKGLAGSNPACGANIPVPGSSPGWGAKLDMWQRGLTQRFAKPSNPVMGSVGSNQTFAARAGVLDCGSDSAVLGIQSVS
jgi:hypothetical protein